MEMIMIKDAAKNLGVESHVLRYWEEELGIEIKRNSMGHRYYDARDIKMFKEVKDLRDRGFSLKDIKDGIERQKEMLRDKDGNKEMIKAHGETKAVMNEDVHSKSQSLMAEEVRSRSELCDVDEKHKSMSEENKSVSYVYEDKHRDMEEARVGNSEKRSDMEEVRSDNDEDKEGQDPSQSLNQLKIVDFKTAQMQNLMNKIVANAFVENRDIITSSIKSEITTDVMKQFDTVMREKEEKEEERYRKLDETIRMLQKGHEEVAATKVKKGLFGKRKRK